MNAPAQYRLDAQDLHVLLAVCRGGTLAKAAERLNLDSSTVFRSVQRIERGLGQQLFIRSRSGYQPTELTNQLTAHAELIEVELEAARSAAQLQPQDVSGLVRITTTDTILHGLLSPHLQQLHQQHPLLELDLQTDNRFVNLSLRDSDIAIRATRTPPQHLVGKPLGQIHSAVFANRNTAVSQADLASANWIAPDEAMPDHPSVHWRKKHYPKAPTSYRVDRILTVMEFIRLGLGVGVLPVFLARNNPELVQLTDSLDDCLTELWLLTHPESRHLRRVSTVYSHLAESLRLD